MKEALQGKHLVESFNRYVEYGRSGKKSRSSFHKNMSEIEGLSNDQQEEGQGSRKAQADTAEFLEPLDKPSKKTSKHKKHSIPRLYNAKGISMRHAERLSKLAPLIEDAARRNNVPVELICGVILQESGGNTKAVSHAGAKGLMQLMPGTARRFGVQNAFDARQNIEGGTKYLRFLLDRFDGNVELALAGYNAGEGNVEKYGKKIPPFKETQAYVPAVLGFTQSMIEIFASKLQGNLPSYARRV